jgi:hypothetical protein
MKTDKNSRLTPFPPFRRFVPSMASSGGNRAKHYAADCKGEYREWAKRQPSARENTFTGFS